MIHPFRIPIGAFAAVALTCLATAAFGQSTLVGTGNIAINAAGQTSPASETFGALASTGTTGTSLPTGWYFLETGTNANNNYAVGTGSSNAGNTYSFGATGSTERAFGSVASGSLVSRMGAQLLNSSGGVITAITISYTGEQWRRGTATDDGLAFSYSTTATGLADTFSWTSATALNFVSPKCGTTDSATDGNSAACRTAVSSTISGLAIVPNGTLWIRWSDANNTANDDGVAIDDVTITATISFISTVPTATGSATPSTVNPGGSTVLAGSITPGFNPQSATLAVACDLSRIGGSPGQALAVTGTTFSFNATVGLATPPGVFALPCTVSDDQARTSAFNIAVTVLLPLNSACGAPATAIDAIQGSGLSSPLAGQVVDIEGIVTGDFQAANQLGGFYIEEPPATRDGNAATSEGMFVFATTPDVSAGDRVRIRGTVNEFGTVPTTLTELVSTSNATVCSSGNPLPAPPQLTLPLANASDFERYEGMRVQINQPLVVTGTFSLGTFGQIDVAPSVLYQPTQAPGNASSWAAATDLIARSKLGLDDGSTLSNTNLGIAPFPAPGLSNANTLRVGALVNPNGGSTLPLIGILDDRFGSYRIQPTAPVTFANSAALRPDTAAISSGLGGRIRVASANVLNFFITLGSRGAATPSEFVNQRIKIVAELSKLNADIYGLSEIQNFSDGNTGSGSNTYTNAALADLTTALATATGRNFQFVDTLLLGALNGTDAIRSVFVYDPAKVTLVGAPALYYQNDQNRPSLAQTFKPASGAKADQQTFTVVVNHFRSKGTGCGAGDDVFQGGCNSMRLSMANAVRNWLASNPTADPAGADRRVLLIGDFNAYFGEDPIQSFETNGYTNLINMLLGAGAYSYNFGSQAGYLDHAIVNAALKPLIKAVAELHVNADEPAALEALNTSLESPAAQAAYFAPNEFAASDHDPIVIALNPLAGDLDDNGTVDLADRNLIVASYGKPASLVDRRMDYDGDGVITPNDYRIWLSLYRAFIQ